MPSGIVALLVVALLIFFGLAHRALDRMRLTDTQALVAIALLVAGSFVDLPLLRGPLSVRVNLGGAVLPVALAGYLLARADTAAERVRSLVGAVITASVVLAVSSVTDFDPGRGDWVDPLWLFSGVGGLVGYLVGGRSRRAAFISGSMGLLLTDVVQVVRAARAGVSATLLVGGAGAFDMIVLGGLIAVGLAEVVGETRERLSGGPGEPKLTVAIGLAIGSALSLLPAGDARAATQPPPLDERVDGGYYALVDESGRPLTLTARVLGVGDGYIDARNQRWQVVRVVGDRVVLRRIGIEPMPEPGAGRPAGPGQAAAGAAGPAGAGPAGGPPAVAIYFTHSDESYVPTSGRASKPRGDVYAVGESLADRLRRQGYRVTVSPNNHNPHDGQAYLRSRRTAAQLMRLRPAALVDVHRDAVPPQLYETRVLGRPAVRVRLVVGRQNPHMSANLEFAKRLKSLADRELPGIVEGIFLARGDYNQDLSPRAILLEFGAHTNPLELAETAAQMFAPLIPQAAGAAPGTAAPAGRQLGAAAWRALAALLITVSVAVAAYVALNRPEALRRLGDLRLRVRRLGIPQGLTGGKETGTSPESDPGRGPHGGGTGGGGPAGAGG